MVVVGLCCGREASVRLVVEHGSGKQPASEGTRTCVVIMVAGAGRWVGVVVSAVDLRSDHFVHSLGFGCQ